jgi:hypothetical protein
MIGVSLQNSPVTPDVIFAGYAQDMPKYLRIIAQIIGSTI